jgi:hypothetical protein
MSGKRIRAWCLAVVGGMIVVGGAHVRWDQFWPVTFGILIISVGMAVYHKALSELDKLDKTDG